MTLRLKTPLGEADARKLRAGDSVLLTGVIYTARDAAHKRLCELVEAGKPLPFDPMDAVVYYVGPTPAAARSDHRFGGADDLLSDGMPTRPRSSRLVCAA